MFDEDNEGGIIPPAWMAVDELVADIFGDSAAVDLTTLGRRLHLCAETLRRHAAAGRLAGVLVGGRWRIGRAGLAMFLQRRPRRAPGPTRWNPETAYRRAPAVPDDEGPPAEEPPPDCFDGDPYGEAIGGDGGILL